MATKAELEARIRELERKRKGKVRAIAKTKRQPGVTPSGIWLMLQRLYTGKIKPQGAPWWVRFLLYFIQKLFDSVDTPDWLVVPRVGEPWHQVPHTPRPPTSPMPSIKPPEEPGPSWWRTFGKAERDEVAKWEDRFYNWGFFPLI